MAWVGLKQSANVLSGIGTSSCIPAQYRDCISLSVGAGADVSAAAMVEAMAITESIGGGTF